MLLESKPSAYTNSATSAYVYIFYLKEKYIWSLNNNLANDNAFLDSLNAEWFQLDLWVFFFDLDVRFFVNAIF